MLRLRVERMETDRRVARRSPRPGSVAEAVRAYIDARPVVRDSLAMGIVNLSALTRRIMDETGISSEEAVLVACRRYQFQPIRPEYEAGIRRVLSKSKLEVRTRVALLTARPSWQVFAKLEKAMNALRGRNYPMHVIQGSESLTVITDEAILQEMEEILGKDDIIKKRTGLVELNLRSSDVIEDVPGILAFVATSLAAKGVNFVEVISCYKDNMFLIAEPDLFAAFEVLNGLIGH